MTAPSNGEAETKQNSPKRSGSQPLENCPGKAASAGALLQEACADTKEGVRAPSREQKATVGAWLLRLQATTASFQGPIPGSSEPLH